MLQRCKEKWKYEFKTEKEKKNLFEQVTTEKFRGRKNKAETEKTVMETDSVLVSQQSRVLVGKTNSMKLWMLRAKRKWLK